MSNNRFETLQREFPDFDISTLPLIPAAWIDVSWHNDACPCFQDAKTGLFIYVDFADTKAREFPEAIRFTVVCINDDNGESETIHSSDAWDSVLACVALFQFSPETTGISEKLALAREFGSLMQGALNRADFTAMVDRNKALAGDSPICHSHDFCDANMIMLQAFETVFGRKPALLCDNATADDETRDSAFWNDAWQIAKAADFFA